MKRTAYFVLIYMVAMLVVVPEPSLAALTCNIPGQSCACDGTDAAVCAPHIMADATSMLFFSGFSEAGGDGGADMDAVIW